MLKNNFPSYMNKTIIKEKIFYLILVILPFLYFFSRELTTISIISLCILWMLSIKFNSLIYLIKNNIFIILLCGLYLIFALSTIYSKNLKEAVSHLEIKASLFIFPLILGTLKIHNKKVIDYIFISFSIGWLIKFLISLINAIVNFYFIQNKSFVNFFSETHYFIIEFHRQLNFHYVYFSIAFIIVYVYFSEIFIKKLQLLFYFIFILFGSIIVLFIQSRVAIIIFFIITEIYIVRFFHLRFKNSLKLILSLSIYHTFLIGIFFFTLHKTELLSRFFNNSMFDRSNIIILAFKSLKNNFNLFFGDGIGDSQQRLYNIYLKYQFLEYYNNKYNAHNQYLEIFLSNGLIGLFYFLFILIYPLYLALKNKKTIYILFSITFLIAFLTESWLNTNKGVVLYSFFNSLLIFNYLLANKLK